MKEDQELDVQREKADAEILENAEHNQPEGERVVSNADDLTSVNQTCRQSRGCGVNN